MATVKSIVISELFFFGEQSKAFLKRNTNRLRKAGIYKMTAKIFVSHLFGDLSQVSVRYVSQK